MVQMNLFTKNRVTHVENSLRVMRGKRKDAERGRGGLAYTYRVSV